MISMKEFDFDAEDVEEEVFEDDDWFEETDDASGFSEYLIDTAEDDVEGNVQEDNVLNEVFDDVDESKNEEEQRSYLFSNQIGFVSDGYKSVVINDDVDQISIVSRNTEKKEYILYRAPNINSDLYSKTNGSLFDLSIIKNVGDYDVFIRDDNVGSFSIEKESYLELFKKLGQSYYHWHCGIKKDKAIVNEWAHEKCHRGDENLAFHLDANENGRKDVSGGWHDAGDYNKYVCPTAVTVWQLLLLSELKPDYKNFDFGLESVYSKKQYMNIIKVGLDWLLKMQRDDGAFYHKVSEKTWSSHIPADEDDNVRYVMPISLEATIKAVAVLYKASVSFAEEYSIEAKQYRKAADKGYKAVMENREMFPDSFENPNDVVTGPYSDKRQEDNLFWMMTERYLVYKDAASEKELKNILEQVPKKYLLHGIDDNWMCVSQFGVIDLLMNNEDADFVQPMKTGFFENLSYIIEKQEQSIFGMYAGESLQWGSNGTIAMTGVHLYVGYSITNRESYLTAAWKHLNYLLGNNPLGFSFVTGFGDNAPENPHYRPSTHKDGTPPGFLVGGANSGYDAGDFVLAEAKKQYPGEPAMHYTDSIVWRYASWASNEVAIYWNAPLFTLVGCLL
jgi:endoglucanase